MVLFREFVEKTSPSKFAGYLDHTLLKPIATFKDLEKAVEDTKRYGFACLVIPPSLLEKAREISGNTIRLATVIGFPLGSTLTRVKEEEAREAVSLGAVEIDMVMNINMFKSGAKDYVLEDMRRVVEASKKAGAEVVKVIIETGLLSDDEKIEATRLVVESGADYVKTSTGFLAGGANVHDVSLLYKAGGGRIKVKAAGGIRHAEDAIAMILAGASRIGTSTAHKIIEEYIRLREEMI